MDGTRKNWGGYIGLVGLLVWGISLVLGQAWLAVGGFGFLVAVIGGIVWGAGMIRRRLRAAKMEDLEVVLRRVREDR